MSCRHPKDRVIMDHHDKTTWQWCRECGAFRERPTAVWDSPPQHPKLTRAIREHVESCGWELISPPVWNKKVSGWVAAIQTDSTIRVVSFSVLCADGSCVVSRPHRTVEELEKLLAEREATLDAISYRCADYDVNYSMADSMLESDEDDPSSVRIRAFSHGQARAGAEIDKLIEASGYRVKERPEGHDG